MKVIVLASNNAHKVQEIQSIFTEYNLDIYIISQKELLGDHNIDIEETGSTLQENAMIKADAIYSLTGLPVLADDTGLEVSSLDFAPGVYSARYAGEHGNDSANRNKLLIALAQKTDRTARFRTVLHYKDSYHSFSIDGICHGNIIDQERGNNGFGYDSLFIPIEQSLTFAEMSDKSKNHISHRALAAKSMAVHLSSIHHSNHIPQEIIYCILISVLASMNRAEELSRLLHKAFEYEYTYDMMYEALLQVYLFAGFPAALEALSILHKVYGSHSNKKLEEYNVELFTQRGKATCKQIYTHVYDTMMNKLHMISPEMSEWMIIEGYGKTLSRPGLSLQERELCIIAILAAGNWKNQLYSHIRGALLLGIKPAIIKETCSYLLIYKLTTEYHSAIAILSILTKDTTH